MIRPLDEIAVSTATAKVFVNVETFAPYFDIVTP